MVALGAIAHPAADHRARGRERAVLDDHERPDVGGRVPVDDLDQPALGRGRPRGDQVAPEVDEHAAGQRVHESFGQPVSRPRLRRRAEVEVAASGNLDGPGLSIDGDRPPVRCRAGRERGEPGRQESGRAGRRQRREGPVVPSRTDGGADRGGDQAVGDPSGVARCGEGLDEHVAHGYRPARRLVHGHQVRVVAEPAAGPVDDVQPGPGVRLRRREGGGGGDGHPDVGTPGQEVDGMRLPVPRAPQAGGSHDPAAFAVGLGAGFGAGGGGGAFLTGVVAFFGCELECEEPEEPEEDRVDEDVLDVHACFTGAGGRGLGVTSTVL